MTTQLATCVNGHPVPNLLACRACLSDELDLDSAEDRRIEASDDY